MRPESAADALLHWFDQHGRHDLPWQHPRTPYRVWVSEIMLQQTQVGTVIGYFERFMRTFPTLESLADAGRDQVLAQWSGLGYYRRARFLHEAAQICVAEHGGELPETQEALQRLPGIGRSTAAAILSQAHGKPAAILDGNVKRVLSRLHGIHGWPGESRIEKRLWTIAEGMLPGHRIADYSQAIMDLGATLCVRGKPACARCPWRTDCVAHRQGLTDQLPTPPPKRNIPQRDVDLAVCLNADRILLRRRPPTGVWPDLWSLPSIEETAEYFHASQIPDADSAERILPPITHRFTHFALTMRPRLFRIATSLAGVADTSAWAWHDRDSALELGLPAPIRTLIRALEDFDPCPA